MYSINCLDLCLSEKFVLIEKLASAISQAAQQIDHRLS